MLETTLYPEHQKLHHVADKSQVCGEFIEWLQREKHIVLAEYLRKHERGCDGTCLGTDDECLVAYRDELCPTFTTMERLLAEFFEIDLDALEREKEAMITELRSMQKEHS